jgi:hypothetical protein
MNWDMTILSHKMNDINNWHIDARKGWGRRVRSEKLSHKNAIKHGKSGPPRFFDNPKYPTKQNLAKTLRTPHYGQLCSEKRINGIF